MPNLSEHLTKFLDQKTFAHLATVMADGSPQVSPVWIDHADGYIRVNSAKGRVKDANMRREPNVAISMVDPDDPYSFTSIKGKVVEITEDGAEAHIDALAYKYLGVDTYPYRQETETRVTYKIEVQQIAGKNVSSKLT